MNYTVKIPSPICSIPQNYLQPIQRGTLRYKWRGVLCNKNPFDLALYPMLLWNERPKTIIEIGSNQGGSALWLHDICSSFELGTRIISIDLNLRAKVVRDGIEFRQGNARDLGTVLSPQEMASLERPLLVIEDADHTGATTLAVLRFFDAYLRPGEYIVVEDGICDSLGMPEKDVNRGIEEFMSQQTGRYEIDRRYCDFFGHNVTWNTNGYIRRIA